MSDNLLYAQTAEHHEPTGRRDNGLRRIPRPDKPEPPRKRHFIEAPLSEEAILKMIYAAGITIIAAALIICSYLAGGFAFIIVVLFASIGALMLIISMLESGI